MRTKAMITGAIAAIGIATLTANASSAPQPRSLGSVLSLVAGTTKITKADRDDPRSPDKIIDGARSASCS